MGELKLIEKFRAGAPGHPWLTVGPGQDCAILNWPADRDQAFKIDQVQEGTHFVLSGPGAATPYQVGWKAMAKTCSDIAAAGCWPVAATVAVNLRAGSPDALALEIYDGLCACCRRYGFALAGGDLSVSPGGLSVVVSMLGEGPRGKAWLRRGAVPGDVLLVTGTLGASRGRKHLTFEPRLEQSCRIRTLAPDGIHACIDITDGLSRDLHHLCAESNCGALINAEKIPYSPEARAVADAGGRSALTQALEDGEDFELLLAVSPESAAELVRQWQDPVALTEVGRILSKTEGLVVADATGRRQPLPDVGWEHR